METFIRGDILVVNFPFTDFSQVKRRPVFVIKQRDSENYIICPITSSLNREKYSFELLKNYFTEGDLKKDKSYVKYDLIITTNKSLIKYKIGKLKTEIVNLIIEKLVEYIKN